MIFEFLGQAEGSFSFRTIDEGIKKDYGVFDADYNICINKEAVEADQLLPLPTGLSKQYEHIVVTDKTDYFEGVDINDNAAFSTACKSYLSEKKGVVFPE